MDHWERQIWSQPIDFAAPLQQARSAYSFLSQATIVGRYLFPGNKRRDGVVRRRCARIRDLLDIGPQSCSAIRGLGLRNDWEHMDERLDRLFSEWDGSLISTEQIRVMKPDDHPRRKVFIGIDPCKKALYFLGNVTELEPVEQELIDIKSRIDPAFQRLGKFEPLFSKLSGGGAPER